MHSTHGTGPLRRYRKVRHAGRIVAAGALGFVVLFVSGCTSDEVGSDQGTGSSAASSGPDRQDPGEPVPTEGDTAERDRELHPDVVEVELSELDDDSYTVSATLSSPYDSPERYADAWRVLDPDGNELGVRELAHDHADEQPFTRSTTITIPGDVAEVTVQGRDQISGYGGETVTVQVPRTE